MKNALIILAVILLMPLSVFGQAMGKKTAAVISQPMPSDGWVKTNAADLDTTFKYESVSNVLIGGGYDAGVNFFIGYAYPISDRAWLIATGNRGELTDNEEYDGSLRGYYQLTDGSGSFNIGLLLGIGPMWEKLTTTEIGYGTTYIARFATIGGIAATYSAFGKVGFWAAMDRQIAGDPFGADNIKKDRLVIGVNLLL